MLINYYDIPGRGKKIAFEDLIIVLSLCKQSNITLIEFFAMMEGNSEEISP